PLASDASARPALILFELPQQVAQAARQVFRGLELRKVLQVAARLDRRGMAPPGSVPLRQLVPAHVFSVHFRTSALYANNTATVRIVPIGNDPFHSLRRQGKI